LADRLSQVPNVRRAAVVKDDHGKAYVRVYPKSESHNGELARNVMAAAACWQVEELHTEEGRLDEVFRSITMPDTAEVKK
jgi:ABC-2 type transport system ATP-binding protein